MKFKLARLSICECGFTVLNESIPLGTVYDTGPLVIKSNATLICGGCGSQIEGDWIYFKARGDSHEGFLPMAAFEPCEERPLTADEEIEILQWCHANPEADLQSKIAEWRARFCCSKFSIMQTFVKEKLGQIKIP